MDPSNQIKSNEFSNYKDNQFNQILKRSARLPQEKSIKSNLSSHAQGKK
jgi:hypothetical protein